MPDINNGVDRGGGAPAVTPLFFVRSHPQPGGAQKPLPGPHQGPRGMSVQEVMLMIPYPAHVEIEYWFWYLTWAELESKFSCWQEIEDRNLTWEGLETCVD
mgnify:CR=1 FL=1